MSGAGTDVGDETHAVVAAATRLLAVREHSRRELHRKLARHGWTESVRQAALDRLEGDGLLSERRFAVALAEQRQRKGYGPLHIRAELIDRGIDADLIEEALQDAAVDWDALLHDVAARRFGRDAGPPDLAERLRRGRQLSRRGFPIGMVRGYLNGLSRS